MANQIGQTHESARAPPVGRSWNFKLANQIGTGA